jgi:hypothetical protein
VKLALEAPFKQVFGNFRTRQGKNVENFQKLPKFDNLNTKNWYFWLAGQEPIAKSSALLQSLEITAK